MKLHRRLGSFTLSVFASAALLATPHLASATSFGCFLPSDAAGVYVSQIFPSLDRGVATEFSGDPQTCEKQCSDLGKGCAKVVKDSAKCLSDAFKALQTSEKRLCKELEDKKACIASVKSDADFLSDLIDSEVEDGLAACVSATTTCVPNNCSAG